MASAREPWVSQTGLTESQLDSRLTTWVQAPYRLAPACLSGYEEGGVTRYAALWTRPADRDPRRVLRGQTAASLTSWNTSLQANGWRLVWLNGFESGGTDYYNAIYRQTDGVAQALRLGDTLASHQSAAADLAGDGYSLENLCAFRSGSTLRYAAYWNHSLFSLETAVSYGLTADEYQAEFNLRAGAWRIHQLCGYKSTGSDDRYTVIWRKPAMNVAWQSIHGMEKLNYFAAQSNRVGVGWRPSFQQAWESDGEIRFNAIWVADEGLPTSRLSELDAAVSDYMDDRNLPGLSLAISHQGRLVFQRAYGLADQASNEWAGTDHRWRLASVSKTICAVAALRALEDSPSWSLDSRAFGSGALFASDYGAAAYGANEQAITLRQLMTMTAGWNSEGRLWYEAAPAYGTNHAQIIGYQLDSVPQAWIPGTHYRYNNFNYQVAARIPEKITGKSFEAYTQEQVFDRCGITSLDPGGRTAADKLFNEVSYYEGPVFGAPSTVWPARMDGSTAWIAKPADLLLLARRIDGDSRHRDILGSYAISQMRLPNNEPDDNGDASGYGLGLYPSVRGGHTWWQHNGAMAGTQAILAYSEGGDHAFAYATNSVSSSDTYSSTFRNLLIDWIEEIDDAGQWPKIDLFSPVSPAYDAWKAERFSALDRGQPGLRDLVWGPEADPDGDDLANSAEYYLALDPLAYSRSPFILTVVGDNLRVRWRKNTAADDVTLTYQTSTNLQSWSSATHSGITDRPDLITTIGTMYQELLIPMNSARRFVRFQFQTE